MSPPCPTVQRRPVDWTDAYERAHWLADVRTQAFDLTAAALDATLPPSQRQLRRESARELAKGAREALDNLFALAGAPREPWLPVPIPLPPRLDFKNPPAWGADVEDPFALVPVNLDPPSLPAAPDPEGISSFQRRAVWLGRVRGLATYLARIACDAGPQEDLQVLRAASRLTTLLDGARVNAMAYTWELPPELSDPVLTLSATTLSQAAVAHLMRGPLDWSAPEAVDEWLGAMLWAARSQAHALVKDLLDVAVAGLTKPPRRKARA